MVDVFLRACEADLRYSYSTVWRVLARHALRPWLQEQWLFPRDPRLAERAGPVLDLYHRRWRGEALPPGAAVLCADEMTGLQAKRRLHRTLPPAPGRRARYEFEYERHGTLCYTAFLNAGTGRIFGETHPGNGIAPFEQTLARALETLCPRAERVFLIVDNGSAHHPSTSPARIRAQHPQVEVVHLPVHSSWLNQVELYFSIVQRKLLSPADWESTDALARGLAGFQCRYNEQAQPFNWRFGREELARFMERLGKHEAVHADAQAHLAEKGLLQAQSLTN